MTTTTLPFTITCPDWCEVPADEHIRDLWNMEGNCIHHLPLVQIKDRVGLSSQWNERKLFGDVVEFNLTTHTSPDGRETAPPTVFLGSKVMSVSQALELAETLHSMVRAYRAAGGVA